jgi:hypothetical protein
LRALRYLRINSAKQSPALNVQATWRLLRHGVCPEPAEGFLAMTRKYNIVQLITSGAVIEREVIAQPSPALPPLLYHKNLQFAPLNDLDFRHIARMVTGSPLCKPRKPSRWTQEALSWLAVFYPHLAVRA